VTGCPGIPGWIKSEWVVVEVLRAQLSQLLGLLGDAPAV
jgi:hypothetical protein